MFKNTAGQAVTFLVVDTATGLEKTGDGGNITPYYQLDDGTVTAISSPSVTEISSTHAKGLYKCSLTQGETNGDKILFSGVSVTSGVVVVPVTVYTIPSAFGLVAGAAGGLFIAGTNAATTITTALTTTFTGNLTGSVASVTAGVTLAAGAIQAIWDALTSALTTAGSIGKLLVDNINATVSSRLASASITLSGGAVTVGTNNDKTGYGLSAAAVQAIWDALTSALTTAGSVGKLLTDNIGTIATINNKIGAFTGSGLNTILGFLRAMARKDAAITPSDMAGTFDNTTDSLEAIEDNGLTSVGNVTVGGYVAGQDPATYVLVTPANKLATDGTGQVTVGTIATAALAAIWNILTSGFTTAGSIGKLLVDNINATISSRLASASITLSGGAVTVGTNNDKTGYSLTSAYDPAKTAAQAGDAMALTSGERTTLAGVIWAALTSALTTAGSIGKLLVDNINATISSRLATAGYAIPPTAAENADAVWDEILSGHLTVGTTGEALNNSGGSGAGATASAIADAVWDEVRADHTTTGTFGEGAETILSRIGAFTGTGINNILGFLLAMMRSDIPLTPSDVGGSYDNTTKSLEAIADGAIVAVEKDWTDSERSQIRQALGILGTTSATTGTGILDEVLTNTARLTDSRANNLDAIPAINTGVAELVATNTDYTDVTSVVDAKMTPAKGIRFLVGRFLNPRTQNAAQQVLKNDAGDVIATIPLTNVSGEQRYGQAA